MVKINQKFSQIEDVTILEFGKGDILVTEGKGSEDDYACLMFTNQEPNQIGEENNSWKGKTSDELKPQVVMIFDKQESIDVVIEKLLDVKNQLSKLNITIEAA